MVSCLPQLILSRSLLDNWCRNTCHSDPDFYIYAEGSRAPIHNFDNWLQFHPTHRFDGRINRRTYRIIGVFNDQWSFCFQKSQKHRKICIYHEGRRVRKTQRRPKPFARARSRTLSSIEQRHFYGRQKQSEWNPRKTRENERGMKSCSQQLRHDLFSVLIWNNLSILLF